MNKEEKFELLIMQYCKASKMLALLDKGFLVVKDSPLSNSEINDFKNTKAIIDAVLSLLLPEEREMIFQEYIERQSTIWWINKYSRSAFYRTRKKAVDNFMEYFNMKCRISRN